MWSERLIGLQTFQNAAGQAIVFKSSPDAKRCVFPGLAGTFADTGDASQALAWLSLCRNLVGTTPAVNSFNIGFAWTYGFPIYGTNFYNHFGQPNTLAYWNPTEEPATPTFFAAAAGIAPPTSNHAAGVNVCMSDGSVRFIKDTINLTTWWALGTRAGAEVIDQTSY
jgi:hypothetical protein